MIFSGEQREKITRKCVPGLRLGERSLALCSLLLLPRRTLQLFERVVARLETVETDVKQYRSTLSDEEGRGLCVSRVTRALLCPGKEAG